ncbi:MAG TPA: hypothetical protein VKW78_02165 [Terriglobales bacterium]|nr:hypothetical protein [Terriglobales bacterium]
MIVKTAASVLLAFALMPSNSLSQTQAHRTRTGVYHTGRASKENMYVVPDLSERLAKWKHVEMPFKAQRLTARQRQEVEKLVEACRYLEDIYWRQSDPEGLMLYQELSGSQNARDIKLKKFLFINAGRFDLLNDFKPFVGHDPMPPGRGFYSQGLTREQIEQYVKDHPEQKNGIYSPYTVVRRDGDELHAIRYSVAYRSFLEPAARSLREAAALSDDKDFAKFLRMRADALLSDDYYASDLAWLDLKDPKIDVIFAPYETYIDGLLGVKTSYGPAVLIRNEAESKKLAIFQQYVPDLQDALPLSPEDKPSKKGLQTPMEVVDSPYRAGDLRHGYQAVADNLPNDPRIHQAKGSKKIFFKNFMDARVTYIVLPLAKRLMVPTQATKATAEGYFLGTLAHEISHGLGPAFSRQNGKQIDTREAIGPLYGGLEESKADIVGLYCVKWMVDNGKLPKERLDEAYASHIADLFRAVRFGVGEGHGRGEMMEFNFFVEQGAIRREVSGKYFIDFTKMPDAVTALAKELLDIEATGDRARGEAWFKRYGDMPAQLSGDLAKTRDIPVDLDPTFSFKDRVE